MRTLLALVLALLCGTMEAAIFNNDFTTNSYHATQQSVPVSTGAGNFLAAATTGTNAYFMRRTGIQWFNMRLFDDGGNRMSLAYASNAPPNIDGITNSTDVIGIGDFALSGLVVTNGLNIYGIGDSALATSSLLGSSSQVFAFGDSALSGLTVSNVVSFYGIGKSVGTGMTGDGFTDVYVFGNSGLQNAVVTASDNLYGFGIDTFSNSAIDNSFQLYSIGGLAGATVTGSDHIFALGNDSFTSATITNSDEVYGVGINAASSAVLQNVEDVYAIGTSALDSAALTNSTDVYAIGSFAGSSLSGTFNSVFMLGTGATATEDFQFIFGNAYNTFVFPAAVLVANYLTLSGTTNQYTDNGTTLLRNGVPIGGSSVSVNGTNVSPANFTNTASVTYALSGSNILATAVVPAGTASASGTANTVAKFTSTTNLGNSSFTDNGTAVTMTEPLLFSADNSFDIGASNVTRPRYVWAGSAFRAPLGSATAPAYSFDIATNSGFYGASGSVIRIAFSGSDNYAFGANFTIAQGNGIAFASSGIGSSDLFLGRDAAATLQLGADSATPTAQTVKGADGSGTNIKGGDTTLGSGKATGTNYGGTIYFATTTPGTTGTGQGIYTNRAWVDGTNGNFNVGGSLVLSAATQTAAYTDNGTSLLRNGVAVGGGSGMQNSTNYRSSVIALTMTGTNVDASQIDWLKTNVCYRLTLTGNAFFGDAVCINVPDTNSFQWLQLNIVEDGTGAHTLTFTNSIYAGVNGSFVHTTNANSWDSLTLLNSPQTNGNVAVLPSNFLHR